MWSITHCDTTQQLNSYTLEMLRGLQLSGVYNARWLWAFELHKGTKRAMQELAHLEEQDGEEGLDLGDESEE